MSWQSPYTTQSLEVQTQILNLVCQAKCYCALAQLWKTKVDLVESAGRNLTVRTDPVMFHSVLY